MRRFSYLLFFILCFTFLSSVATAQEVPTYQPPKGPAFSPDKIIVKYKDIASTPQSLLFQVQQRMKKKNNGINGFLDYYFQTLSLRTQNKSTPEERLIQINDIKSQLGIIQESILFSQTTIPNTIKITKL